MKKFLIILIILFLLALTAACTATDQPGQGDNGSNNGSDDPMQYELVGDAYDLEEKDRQLVEHFWENRGYFFLDEYTLVITLGTRPSGGYGLELVDVQRKGDNLILLLEETVPGDDEMVTQALTYPHLILRFAEPVEDLSLEITDMDGTLFDEIDVLAVSGEGILQSANGQEATIEVEGTQETFLYSPDLQSVFDEMLNSGDRVFFRYRTDMGDQPVLTYINLEAREHMVRDQEGIFTGLADNHTMEIMINGQPHSFGFAEQVLPGFFETGDTVVFDYYDDGSRLVITRMTRIE